MNTIKNKETVLDTPELSDDRTVHIEKTCSSRSLLRYPGGKTRGVDFITQFWWSEITFTYRTNGFY